MINSVTFLVVLESNINKCPEDQRTIIFNREYALLTDDFTESNLVDALALTIASNISGKRVKFDE